MKRLVLSYTVDFELPSLDKRPGMVFPLADLCSLWWLIHKQVAFSRGRVAGTGP